MTLIPAYLQVTDTTLANLVSCHELNTSTFLWNQLYPLLQKVQHQSATTSPVVTKFDGTVNAAILDTVYFILSQLYSATGTVTFAAPVNVQSLSSTSTPRWVCSLLSVTDNTYDDTEPAIYLLEVYMPNITSGSAIPSITLGVPSTTALNPPVFATYNYGSFGYSLGTPAYTFLQFTDQNSLRVLDSSIRLSTSPSFAESVVINNLRKMAVQKKDYFIGSNAPLSPAWTLNSSSSTFPYYKVTLHFIMNKGTTTSDYVYCQVGSSTTFLTAATDYNGVSTAIPDIVPEKQPDANGIPLNLVPLNSTADRLTGSITFRKMRAYSTGSFEKWLYEGRVADLTNGYSCLCIGEVYFNATVNNFGGIKVYTNGGVYGTLWVTYS